MLEDKELSCGIYRIKHDTMTVKFEDIVKKDDKIRIVETDAKPIDEVLGLDIYKGIHEKSKQWVYFTTGEITR
jgi:hypothetical protein